MVGVKSYPVRKHERRLDVTNKKTKQNKKQTKTGLFDCFMTREVNRKSDILMIGVWISTQHNSCQRGDELLPAKNSLMGIDSPLTGAPSMISYLATVSVSVVVLGPEKEDKDFTT